MSAIDSGLADKTVLVTGGSRGIGPAIVERFAAYGADVTFFYRGNESAAKEVVDAVAAAGGKASAEQVDITDVASVTAAVERLIERRGRIDVLVNNAGVARLRARRTKSWLGSTPWQRPKRRCETRYSG